MYMYHALLVIYTLAYMYMYMYMYSVNYVVE